MVRYKAYCIAISLMFSNFFSGDGDKYSSLDVILELRLILLNEPRLLQRPPHTAKYGDSLPFIVCKVFGIFDERIYCMANVVLRIEPSVVSDQLKFLLFLSAGLLKLESTKLTVSAT